MSSQRERTVTVVGVCGTLRMDGCSAGGYEVSLVDVPRDEASALADLVNGGPKVTLAPFGVPGSITRQTYPYGWTFWIRTLTPEEAFRAIDDLAWLARWGDAVPDDQLPMTAPVTGRLRCGSLVDVEPWQSPDIGISLTAEQAAAR